VNIASNRNNNNNDHNNNNDIQMNHVELYPYQIYRQTSNEDLPPPYPGLESDSDVNSNNNNSGEVILVNTSEESDEITSDEIKYSSEESSDEITSL
jgi:hypothetical protein